MADSGHTTPAAGKDMKNVIAQFQQANKANLRPTGGGAKPKPQIGQKSSMNEQADTGNDAARLPRKLKPDNQEGSGNSTASEAANPFKVALKPVARTTSGPGGVVAAKNFANQKSMTEGDKPVTSPKDGTSEPTPKVSSIANKSKMFEQQQKQSEVVTPGSPTTGAASARPRSSANCNALKAPVVPKPQTKPTPAADPIQKLNGTSTTASSANKWKKPESKPDEVKPTDQKPDTKKEFPFRKVVQDETKAGDDAEPDDKVGNTNFATMRPVKSTPLTTKPSFPVTGSTLPKQFKPPMVASKINKATTEPEREDDEDQPKIPPKPSNKAEQPKIHAKTTEDLVQPRIPPRSTDKAEQPKPFAKTTEDIDQPKVPLRRDQKKLDESTLDKTASKHPLPDSRKSEENRPKKGSDLYDQNANKVVGKSAELPPPRNMGRPLPKPAEKQYRLLPIPKQKGKPPKKKAKPPVVDLSKYSAYATPKSVLPVVTKQLSVEAYDDGDDIYEDCDNMEVTVKQSSRISEYSEEEEAKLEKNAKLKPPSTTNTDNYGKMFNAPSIDEYDDDEIYQEID